MWNNVLSHIVKYCSFVAMWNEIRPHICEANISQRSYFTWRSHISLAEGEFRWKKHTLSDRQLCAFFWWGMVDSDHRSQWQQIYSLPPLAAREIPHIRIGLVALPNGAGERSRTINLLITNQLLCHWATPACWTLTIIAESFSIVNTFFEKNQSFLKKYFFLLLQGRIFSWKRV